MAEISKALKSRYKQRTMKEFEEIENAPVDYDKERRNSRRSMRLNQDQRDSSQKEAGRKRELSEYWSKRNKKKKADKELNSKISKGRSSAITGVDAEPKVKSKRVKPTINKSVEGDVFLGPTKTGGNRLKSGSGSSPAKDEEVINDKSNYKLLDKLKERSNSKGRNPSSENEERKIQNWKEVHEDNQRLRKEDRRFPIDGKKTPAKKFEKEKVDDYFDMEIKYPPKNRQII